jgi:hypothetical protein
MRKEVQVREHHVWLISGVCSVLTACSLVIDADTAKLAERQRTGSPSDDGGGPAPTRPCAVDADCSDDDPCSGEERCAPDDTASDARGCVAGAPLNCSDDVACTEDRCVKGSGCTHKPDSTRCDDGVDCTVDVCSLGEGCRNDPNQARCDFCRPGSMCTADQGCVGGFPNDCSDGDSCTVDQCDESSLQCLHFGSCEGGPDTCDDVEQLFPNNGRAVAGGTFGSVAATYDNECGNGGGRDAVYRLRIDAISDIVLDTRASEARAIVAVGTSCDEAGFTLACAGPTGGDRGSSLVIHRFDPAVQGNDLFILVDGESASDDREYVLIIDVAPVAEDSCNVTNVRLPVGGTLLGFMDTLEPANAWGQQQGSCQLGFAGPALPEAIVSFVADDDDTFSFTATSDEFDPILYARGNCRGQGQQGELACNAALFGDNQAEIDVDLAQDAETFLVVDGAQDGASFVLRNVP